MITRLICLAILGVAPLEVGDRQVPTAGRDQPVVDAKKGGTVPPMATLSFPPEASYYSLELVIRTPDGESSTGPLELRLREPEEFRDVVFEILDAAGWAVRKAGRGALTLRGVRRADGSIAPIASGKLTLRGNVPVRPVFAGVTGVTVETSNLKP
jgi:hypothetical protein